jgi:hypothetical protein
MIDIARAYYDQRSAIAGDAPVLRALIEAVAAPNDLSSTQWAQWYSVACAYKPDLILELGRGRGNSTAVFAQAASRLPATKIVSLCRTADWMSLVVPRLASVVAPEWFDRIDARVTDILAVDYDEILAGHERVLLVWDAHGFEIADTVLGEILPKLVARDHLIVMHDILDNRYDSQARRSYDGQPLWKGAAWQEQTGTWGAAVNIGWMHSIQDQVIAVADFAVRNAFEVRSADHEYASFFASQPACSDEMRRVVGGEFFSPIAKWAFWSLTGLAGPFHFPTPADRRPFSHRADLPLDPPRRLPITITTEARSWQYAAAFDWKATADAPPDAPAWLRVRLNVDGGSIGVGLVAENGRDFSVRRAVAPRPRSSTLMLPVASVSRPERLIIQTWAVPAAARVRIEELALVW